MILLERRGLSFEMESELNSLVEVAIQISAKRMRVLPKPTYGQPCNGCGFCCATELCELAEMVFVGSGPPCPALEFEDGRTWCGMVRHPSRHMKLNYTGADALVVPLMMKGLAIGQGCGCPDEFPEGEGQI